MDSKTPRKGTKHYNYLYMSIKVLTLHWIIKIQTYMYNKINVIRHLETRTCLNCNKSWDLVVKKLPESTKKLCFCKDCNEVLTPWQKKKIRFSNDPEYYEKNKQDKRDFSKRHIVHLIWKRAKDRSLKYGYDFNLKESDIIIPNMCPILEVPLVLGIKGNYEYTPSIDRIDNSKGYIKGNIQIISKKANSMKNSASIEELTKFCHNVLRYSLSNREKESAEQEDKEPLG